jgi:hypothetical protein
MNQMDAFEVEVFRQTSDYVELRLSEAAGSGGAGRGVRTRGLDVKAVDAVVEDVEHAYAQDAAGPHVFGSTQLRDLGGKLYAFLDGEERWLDPVLAGPQGASLRISAEERLRHLPWELVAKDGAYLTVADTGPLLPIRAAASVAGVPDPVVGNRPLRVLFMATSPEGVEPVLNFEAEEAAVLEATTTMGTELVVEESGTLEGLRFTVEAYPRGYFDVLHLSGHATIADGRPSFLVENEVGGQALAGADDIARAMSGQWPRLVFVSGCLTAGAPDGGSFPSMSESLVKAGASTVLGWALPVGDASATLFAAHLYQALSAGQPLDRAIVVARRALYTERSSFWHLLRVYADASPLAPMVTPLHTPRRERVKVRHAAEAFLDPQTRLSRVASRADFVGRRRVIQRCLRTLKQPLDAPGAVQALVLQGMGGLGKSTLASRLLERMPTHQRAVWVGRVDLTKFNELTSKVTFPSLDQQIEATELLAHEQVDLTVRLRFLFDGPLGETPCLFVFDDFEYNLAERAGGHVLSAEMAQILPALLTAIRETKSPSRVIITSRYRFPQPAGTTVRFEGLETLTDVEQTKKIANLPNLRPGSPTSPDIRQRAITVAAGNPRLLDWLDRIVADTTIDVDAVITPIENEANRFRREDILAEQLLATQPVELRKMLAKLDVVELPVPAATVQAVHDHPDVTQHIRRAVDLGLLEEGTDPETSQHRYYVSNVLHPLIRPLISDEEYTQACAAAARSLYQLWIDPDLPEGITPATPAGDGDTGSDGANDMPQP